MLIPIGFFGAGAAAGAYELIATNLPSGTASTTFSAIDQTYKHLQIRFTARSNNATQASSSITLRMNGDTAANYSQHTLRGDGTSVTSYGTASLTALEVGTSPTGYQTTTNVVGAFSAGVIDILNYTSATNNKTVRSFYGTMGTDKYSALKSGAWYSVSAVTSLSLSISPLAFAAGSRISLYGIRG